jgi:hypothetical protein
MPRGSSFDPLYPVMLSNLPLTKLREPVSVVEGLPAANMQHPSLLLRSKIQPGWTWPMVHLHMQNMLMQRRYQHTPTPS